MIWKTINAVGYQLVWLTSVARAAHGDPYSGPLAALAFAMLVFVFGGQRRSDLQLVPLVLGIGLLTDGAWLTLHLLDYSAPWPSASSTPAWMLGIWLAFGMTLNHSLTFLKGRYALAALLGAIGGPLAYWSAARGFGALHFIATMPVVFTCLSLAWVVLVPLLVLLADRLHVPQRQVTAS